MADEVELAELDRLLRQELSVEPSADFLPRVRASLHRESEGAAFSGGRGWIGWVRLARWPLAAGLAMLVVAAALVLRQRPEPLMPVRPAEVTVSVPAPVEPGRPWPLDPAPPEPTGATDPLVPTRARSSAAPRPSAGPALAIIVDPGQRAAIARVMVMVNEGRLTEASFVVARPLEMPVIEDVTTTPITVDAVAVSPVAFGGVLQKGTERN